jgi:hypothetical protein
MAHGFIVPWRAVLSVGCFGSTLDNQRHNGSSCRSYIVRVEIRCKWNISFETSYASESIIRLLTNNSESRKINSLSVASNSTW